MAFWNRNNDKKSDEEPILVAPTIVARDISKTVIQSIQEGILVIDMAQNITLANPAAEKLIGRSFDEMQGINYKAMITFVDRDLKAVDDLENPIALAFSAKKYCETRDLEIQSVNGASTSVSIITRLSDDGDLLVVTMRDITKELRSEQAKSEFISTASHEMRTPVASIEGYLGLAMSPTTATIDERAMSYLQKAHEASQRLGKLFQDLLDTTKLEDNRMKPEISVVNLTELNQKIADEAMPMISQKGLQFEFLPSGETGASKVISQVAYAKVDPSFWHEIVINLIENAVKYTPKGKISLSMHIGTDVIETAVADSGIGIEEKDLKHIFQRFYRADNSDTREIGGTGLGLYIVQQRVEMLGGRIRAESQKGIGTRFIVTIPRASADEFLRQKNAI